MQDSLYEFLIVNKKLSLPGIGTLSLRQNSSVLDFGNKEFVSPSYYFIIESANDQPSKKVFDWLSSALGFTEWDALRAINDFSFGLKKNLSEKGEAIWENVGIFKRDEQGNVKLDSKVFRLDEEQPVKAEKVIRENARHTLLVGEQERSSVEMEEFFAEIPARRNYTLLIAVILMVIAIMFIGWYFSEKGFAPSAAGNQSVIKSN